MTVAFVGAGNMGGALVERLCEAHWAVTVCDTDPLRQQQALAAGASLADTPLTAVAQLGPQDALVIVVVDADQCREVLWGEQGAVGGLRPGQTVVLCPTIAPEDTTAIAERLAQQGIACIDAPMSGGPQRARDGRMSLMVAGPPAVLERHADLLAALSLNVMRISERVGDGARTKLVNNLLAGINLVGAAEVLALAERMGLNLSTTLDVIERSSGQSWIGSDRMRRAIDGDLAPRAHVTLLEKDTRLAVAAARGVGFEGPLGASAARVFAQAAEAGMAGLDDAALLSYLRQNTPRP
ncbi:hydroxyacid dehydrogenase [Hydrogenophaga sp. Root209]|uniref:NAD(P)-dependent oxidoreductase n=1 Tax=unclassified Hydrogenophaga TaxID=2610897 RepID=UPI0006F5B374|nr:NAD(P)-dependent oxidoreductase [Hydrogenophaga sp. Root209]KRC04236.1 hydroxyacid dehydrogenase [Hydrogenophaga sp. Root209]